MATAIASVANPRGTTTTTEILGMDLALDLALDLEEVEEDLLGV